MRVSCISWWYSKPWNSIQLMRLSVYAHKNQFQSKLFNGYIIHLTVIVNSNVLYVFPQSTINFPDILEVFIISKPNNSYRHIDQYPNCLVKCEKNKVVNCIKCSSEQKQKQFMLIARRACCACCLPPLHLHTACKPSRSSKSFLFLSLCRKRREQS
jgi:hypothetical protein